MTAFNTKTDYVSQHIAGIMLPSGVPTKCKVVHCDVVFGAPSSGCQGTGICKIVAREENVQRSRNCHNTVAFAAQGLQGEGIMLFFFREYLCSNLMRLHFRHGVLTVKESCRLPDSLIKQLELNIRQIPAGRYCLEDAFGYYRLNLE
jgi:hypothetical protein